MVRYLIQRPVAVLLFFTGLLITGLVVLKKVPVSLLPDADIPRIVLRIDYPNTAAEVLERNIIGTVRDQMANLNHVRKVESLSADHGGIVTLTFDYNTRMDLADIEVNERLDRLTGSFPKDMQRPQVIRSSTADIPVIRIQVVPRSSGEMADASELADKILKKRIEQLEGVSLVDINGRQESVVNVIPKKEILSALGLNENTIIQTIKNANQELGGLSVKDGQYRYFVKLNNALDATEQIGRLSVRTPGGTVIPLRTLASITVDARPPTGYYLYNGKEGIVITVGKQASSRMNQLLPKIKDLVGQFREDYPRIDFSFTQDQSFLLDAGISNLYQDIIYGGILTVALLFMFLGNWASPILMSVSIPVSLIITFIFFYIFGISFNIISLSGLALGIGMLIDNSIVVIDNINRKRRTGLNTLDSGVAGTNEVIVPVISQVLTTVAVYAPLILFNGIAGQLVLDQSIALTISLFVSLLTAFVLAPLLYSLLQNDLRPVKSEDTLFYRWVARGYHRMISHILQHRLIYFLITLAIMPLGFWLGMQLPVKSLPDIERKESLVNIDWNAPIDAPENLRRMQQLQALIKTRSEVTEADVGIRQFMVQQQDNQIQRSDLYYACRTEALKWETDEKIRNWIRDRYPGAIIRIIDAPNAFTQLFVTNTPYLEARLRPVRNTGSPNEYQGLEDIRGKITQTAEPGPGMITEPNMDLFLDYNKMALYGVERSSIETILQKLFGNYTISEINRFGTVNSIKLKVDNKTMEEDLSSMVPGGNGETYPLRIFLTMHTSLRPKFISADKAGEYRSLIFDSKTKDIPALQDSLTALAIRSGFSVEFTGQYFEDRQQLKQLWLIFIIVIFLLFIILAIQYEDLLLPLIVMLTIPLGITGGMFLLWLTGGTLNVMAAIGFIVILGLIVDDPILKVEVLQRLQKEYRLKGYETSDELLKKMIHEAGDICLKPLLLVSLTTSIAMVPVLWIGGIGNDLQKPMAYVIIGGLTAGTFFTTWFIPLAYWYLSKWRKK